MPNLADEGLMQFCSDKLAAMLNRRIINIIRKRHDLMSQSPTARLHPYR